VAECVAAIKQRDGIREDVEADGAFEVGVRWGEEDRSRVAHG
jgi:hypothetical protein